ncbi:MAG: DNA polymerase III subunit delta [Pseudomonadota bacterium]|nr:DNA polymerase III subunit delta [Pseudomonadota bacterium]
MLDAGDKGSADEVARIIREIRAGKIAPAYLLHGEEFLVREALDRIVAALVPEADRAFNLFFTAPEQTDVDRLCRDLGTAPLLPGTKVVVVRQAPFLLAGRQSPAPIVEKIKECLREEPRKAAREFMTFLGIAGWSLADLQDDGWRRIDAAEWSRLLPGEEGIDDLEKWLPRVLDICSDQEGLSPARKTDPVRLEELLMSGLPPGNVLILTAPNIDKRKRLVKIIAEKGRVVQFSAARGEARQQSLVMAKTRALLDRYGKTLTAEAWQALGRRTGFELTPSVQALEKLAVFTGERREIRPEDVEEVIGKTKEESVFALTAALGERAAARALRILRELLVDQGAQPLVVLAMLVREVRFLLHARIFLHGGRLPSWRPGMDYGRFQARIMPEIKALVADREEKGEAGDLAGENPYVIYQACRRAGDFSEEALISCLQELARLDLRLKTTGRNPHLLLEDFILNFCDPDKVGVRAS